MVSVPKHRIPPCPYINKIRQPVLYKTLKPHYRLVTLKEKQTVNHIYFLAMCSGPGIEYNFPLASWTENDALRIISQVRDIIGWNIVFINNNFYHVDWR